MSDVKWIKIATGIFDDEKILLIESMPEADAIIVIWFKLLTLAGKQNNDGIFILNDTIPYTDEMLSTIFRRPLQVVRLALSVFEQFGMIEIVSGTITIPNWEKHQNIDGLEKIREQTRQRVARHREKQRLLAGVDICQYCGEKATGEDHIIPISQGGGDDESNKVACCIRCNRIKNNRPLVDFLNDNRDIINDDIVLSNVKLRQHIELCNATNRYIVTQRNAVDKNRTDKIRKDKNTNKEKPIRNQIPPTLDMVSDYISEQGYNIDAEAFMDYYESKGWLVGKSKMKDWQATVRNWSRNEHSKPSANPFADMLKKGDF